MNSAATAGLGRDAVSGAVTVQRQLLGSLVIWAASGLFVLMFLAQALASTGYLPFGFSNWQPVFVAYGLWSVALCVGVVLKYGEAGFILETNKSMNSGLEAMNGRVVKKYRVYRRAL